MKPEEHLGEKIKIKIDRPMGSKHPKHGFIYPINYGFVPGVMGGDGEELDAYLLGVFEPVEEYEGRLIAVIYREDDVEEKLVIAPKTYTADQISALVEFQERWFHSWVAYCYDKPYWPEDFTIDMPEVQKAIGTTIKDGEFSLAKIAPILKEGYGHCAALGFWLADNGIIEKNKGSKPQKLKVKTYEEAIQKIKIK
ncbi:inorganic diphosphatase [Candidatus Saccharibacteria bacterium]|nr:inorganic diphosphatase [Candidatus Saccharibacteria bacterium]